MSQESLAQGDILMERFYESYLNLTVKSLMLVKFVATNNINADYIFKVTRNEMTTEENFAFTWPWIRKRQLKGGLILWANDNI